MLYWYNASFEKTVMEQVMVLWYITVILVQHNDGRHYNMNTLLAQSPQRSEEEYERLHHDLYQATEQGL